MVLNDIADGTDLLVKCASALDSEIFGHRDLDALYIRAIPKRLEHGVGEAEEQHTVDGLFSQVMVDAENPLFVEGFEQDLIQSACRGEVATKRLFDNDSRVF